MQPDDHIRITLAVLQKMIREGVYIPEEFVNGVEDGLLAPFDMPVKPRFQNFLTHHDYSRSEIRDLVIKARESLKKGETYKAGFSTGLALHYLQDRCLGGPVLHLLGRHRIKERRFNLEPLAEEQIVEGLMDATSDWSKVDWIIDNTEMSYRIKSIMKKACYVTAFVLYSVMQRDPPEEVVRKEKTFAKLRLALSVALGMAATTLVAWFYPIHGYKVLGLLFAWLPTRTAYAKYASMKKWYS